MRHFQFCIPVISFSVFVTKLELNLTKFSYKLSQSLELTNVAVGATQFVVIS